MKFCPNCGTPISNEDQLFCTKCGKRIREQSTLTNDPQIPMSLSVASYPMKWFKFLIYFGLFLGVIINFSNGINYITGMIYSIQSGGDVPAKLVYGVFGNGLKLLDITVGIIFLFISSFGIYTRFRLAKYKANGPMCLYLLYGMNGVTTLIYAIGLLILTDTQLISGTDIGSSLAGSIIPILINYKYFSKRRDLFIN